MSSRSFEKRAGKMHSLCNRLGVPPPSPERVETLFARSEQRRAEQAAARRRADEARFYGCVSVTAAARDLRMRRSNLFVWLARENWLIRADGGDWRATDAALSSGWLVLRGPRSIQWVQVTPLGMAEIARRLGK